MSASRNVSQKLMDQCLVSQAELKGKIGEFKVLERELERLEARAATDPAARRRLEQIGVAMEGPLGKDFLEHMDVLADKAKMLEKQANKLVPADSTEKIEKTGGSLKKIKRNLAGL